MVVAIKQIFSSIDEMHHEMYTKESRSLHIVSVCVCEHLNFIRCYVNLEVMVMHNSMIINLNVLGQLNIAT